MRGMNHVMTRSVFIGLLIFGHQELGGRGE